MKNQRSLGLVVEGNATSSLLLRLPGIVEHLGPVKAGALRVARRLSNFLRAGYAVSSYKDLQPARLIFLRVPDAILPRIVDELCASELTVKDTSFVLCESWLSTASLAPLQTRGALTATLVPVQTPRKIWFAVEGQLSAVRQVRRFLEDNDARTFELRPGTKPLYFAAQLLATSLPIHLYTAAQQALRSAGVKGNHLHELLEEMAFEMFRSFANGVRSPSLAARAGCTAETYEDYLEFVRVRQPQVAEVLDAELSLLPRPRSTRPEG